MCNHIQIDVLSYHFHTLQEVGGDRTNDDAIVVFVERLHLGEVSLFFVTNCCISGSSVWNRSMSAC